MIDLTAEKLEEGEYKDLIPEIYALSSIVENVPWHLNQDVFIHLVKSLRSMETILSGEYTKSIKDYLNQSIDSLPMLKILKLAALLHDVGKDITIKHLPDGSTECAGHEAESAKRIPEYALKFDLSQSQEKLLERLVADHDYGHQAVAKALEGLPIDESLKSLKQHVGDNYIAICLLTIADMRGGDLNQSNPEEFERRQEILKYFLKHA